MKKIILHIIFAITGVTSVLSLNSCKHKDLCYDHPHFNEVNIVIHWDSKSNVPILGMRSHLDLVDGSYKMGLLDISPLGGKVKIPPNNSYRALCYDYMGGGSIYFNNEENFEKVEIYTNTVTRASYSKLYPNEKLIHQPENFYMDKVDIFNVLNPPHINELHFYPTDRVELYTFEIRGIDGVENIRSFAGACSGISRSYFLFEETVSDEPYTVLIYQVHTIKEKNTIQGEFLIFGHCKNTQIPHNFTMEIAYGKDEYLYKTWDVTHQMHDKKHHLIMEWNIQISPPEGTDITVDIIPWDEVWIPVEI